MADGDRSAAAAPVDPRVERYRTVLPSQEFNALSLWADTFYEFQKDWLLEESDFAIANKSRQIGTSHTTGAVGVLWGAFHGEMTTIISIGQLESDEVLDKCKKHVAVLQALGSQCAQTLKSNTSEIVFASGGRILALPSSGGRSFSGNVFLDEFAYQEHATKVWDAAAPVTLLGHKMRVVSTPNGVGNEFYDLWEMATNPERKDAMRSLLPPGAENIAWKPHLVPIDLAIAQGYPVDLARCWALAKGDPRIFAQMFRCSFLDNVMQYVSGETIEKCVSSKPWPLFVPNGEYYGGLDIGREVDFSCLFIIRRDGAMSYPVHVETIKRTDSDGLEAMVARAFEKYKLTRLCIDSTGLGTFPAERMKKKHSEAIDVPHRRPRVECVDFTPTSKELLATGLYSTMTATALALPSDDAQLPERTEVDATSRRAYVVNEAGISKLLKKEIASLQRIITKAGNVIYSTPRTADGHADRAWALMLALHARSATNPMVDALRSTLTR